MTTSSDGAPSTETTVSNTAVPEPPSSLIQTIIRLYRTYEELYNPRRVKTFVEVCRLIGMTAALAILVIESGVFVSTLRFITEYVHLMTVLHLSSTIVAIIVFAAVAWLVFGPFCTLVLMILVLMFVPVTALITRLGFFEYEVMNVLAAAFVSLILFAMITMTHIKTATATEEDTDNTKDGNTDAPEHAPTAVVDDYEGDYPVSHIIGATVIPRCTFTSTNRPHRHFRG